MTLGDKYLQGNVMEELVNLFRTLLRDQEDAEHAVHTFRCIVGHMPPAVRDEIKHVKELRVKQKHDAPLHKEPLSQHSLK